MRPFMTAASAFSPLLVAWIFDARGSYDAAIWLLGACWLVAALTVLLASRPTRTDPRLTSATTSAVR
jgi:cyanate permease